MGKRIAVIGSGFGGLSAAIRLAAAGHQVAIYERRDKLGGRGYQYELDGFKFDGGPTVITAPYMFDELFARAGRRREDYFELVPLDPFYRIFDPQGRRFDYRHREADMLAEVERWSPADREGYQRFSARTAEIFRRLYPYTEQPFLNLRDMAKIMPDVIRLGAFQGMYGYVSRFIKDEFLRQVFSFHPLLVGGNPLDTPSLYSLIVQFEKEWGVHYAVGGTGAIVNGLGRLFADLGGQMHLNSEVAEIVIRDGRAAGLRLSDDRQVAADMVVSNADVAFTYKHLIPGQEQSRLQNLRLDTMRYSNSLYVIYFGTKRRYLDSELAHHNIIINERYRGLLGDVFGGRRLPNDLALYLHMPTRTDESIAPPGCESFYVLALVPNLDADTDWETVGPAYRRRILRFLEENYLPDLQANIIAQHHIDPPHFRHVLKSHKGAAFSFQPSLLQSAWFRPHSRSKRYENLYFVGAGTHPGAGVPAVMASGKIAANLIEEATQAGPAAAPAGWRQRLAAGLTSLGVR
ncbi:MAG: phytoene desaturase family protein [Candidatus Promineifilaceae bacterium]|nr:phytoene desaturase family protein [Candidatus Promineifilaceae bacterium]